MVFRKQAKKAQAAIEFLMTYGWMLLIVLIVGALIFSFVDFGNLIPNQINLNNNLQADSSGSVAYSEDSASNQDLVRVVFQYNGARKATITGESDRSYIDLTVGDTCNSTRVENLDAEQTSTGSGDEISFLNGQSGIMDFQCSGLIEGDTLEGEISIGVEDPQTQIEVPSTGDIRLQIITG